jgi:hypothetical protein
LWRTYASQQQLQTAFHAALVVATIEQLGINIHTVFSRNMIEEGAELLILSSSFRIRFPARLVATSKRHANQHETSR